MSKLNCKIGDLAIVTSARLPQNIGYIVEVMGLQTGRPFRLPWNGHVWTVRSVSGRKDLRYLHAGPEIVTRHSKGPVPDCRLRPVSGLDESDAILEDLGAGRTHLDIIQKAIQTSTRVPSLAFSKTLPERRMSEVALLTLDHSSDVSWRFGNATVLKASR